MKKFVTYSIRSLDLGESDPDVYHSIVECDTVEGVLPKYQAAHPGKTWTLIGVNEFQDQKRGFAVNKAEALALGVKFPFDGNVVYAKFVQESKFDADKAMRATRDLCQGQAGARVWR